MSYELALIDSIASRSPALSPLFVYLWTDDGRLAMTPQEAVRRLRLREQLPDLWDRVLPPDSRSWERDELTFVWHRARADAELACESWRRTLCADGYVVYRTAQNQLDAAQDALGWWVGRRVNGRSPPWGPSTTCR